MIARGPQLPRQFVVHLEFFLNPCEMGVAHPKHRRLRAMPLVDLTVLRRSQSFQLPQNRGAMDGGRGMPEREIEIIVERRWRC